MIYIQVVHWKTETFDIPYFATATPIKFWWLIEIVSLFAPALTAACVRAPSTLRRRKRERISLRSQRERWQDVRARTRQTRLLLFGLRRRQKETKAPLSRRETPMAKKRSKLNQAGKRSKMMLRRVFNLTPASYLLGCVWLEAILFRQNGAFLGFLICPPCAVSLLLSFSWSVGRSVGSVGSPLRQNTEWDCFSSTRLPPSLACSSVCECRSERASEWATAFIDPEAKDDPPRGRRTPSFHPLCVFSRRLSSSLCC